MFHVFQILMPWAEASSEVRAHVARFVRGVIDDAPPIDPGCLADIPERAALAADRAPGAPRVDSRHFGGDHRTSDAWEPDKGGSMPTEHDELDAAVNELTHSMTRFVRALDAVGDSDAANRLSPDFVGAVERLSARLDGMQGLSG